MADGRDDDAAAAAAAGSGAGRSEEYRRLVSVGLDTRVASKLEEIFTTGKLVHAELDERALDALQNFPVDGAQTVLQQFLESNLEHVSNKSAFLCGIMKTYRQKIRAIGMSSSSASSAAAAASAGAAGRSSSSAGDAATPFDLKPVGKGPDENKIREILKRTGYTLDVTTGQRKYGGPPPGWEDPPPPNGCEVFCGKIPRDVYEDELIPLFEQCGTIWDLRLMMDPLTGLNRGYAFVTFTTTDAAHEAVRQLNDLEMKGGRHLKVNVSVPNHRLFVGNIPKSKSKADIMEEFNKVTAGLVEVIIYSSPDDRRKNRGFCFLEYDSHKSASLAKRRLSTGRVKIFGCDIIVDWADPQEEPDQDTMSKVKVLYVRNLTQDFSEEKLKESFELHGAVQRVKKMKDYAFVHFEERQDAVNAMSELNGAVVHGATLEVSLAKPPSDRKKKEEVLKARERRLIQQHIVHRGPSGATGQAPAVVPSFRGGRTPIHRGAGSASGMPYGRPDYDFECGYGPYRGGYADPYYNAYYPYAGGDYYYDYPARGAPASSASRGRSSSTMGRSGRAGRAGRAGASERAASPTSSSRWRPSGGGAGGSGESYGPARAPASGSAHGRTGAVSRGEWTRSGRGSGRPHSNRGAKKTAKEQPESGAARSHSDDTGQPSSAEGGADNTNQSASTPRSTTSSGGIDPPIPPATTTEEESVWYQDSFNTQWS